MSTHSPVLRSWRPHLSFFFLSLFIFIFPSIGCLPVRQNPTRGPTDSYAPMHQSLYRLFDLRFDLFLYWAEIIRRCVSHLLILAFSFTAHVSQWAFFNTLLMISSVFLTCVFYTPARRLKFVDIPCRSSQRFIFLVP